jgi:hypothetical protein
MLILFGFGVRHNIEGAQPYYLSRRPLQMPR